VTGFARPGASASGYSTQEKRGATEAHPDSGDAWNNLAQALLDLGRRDEARAAAQRAVGIGGPRSANYRSTLEAAERAP
jgi:Flp pilus assembly protein TadD